ncbi:predicted protein [Chaetomium globosum CBS 148.51]|uniref:Uncharacterized protein n=1 Tax=Chaetomium globosum (strain ATCC 6205 / CBS 148.51 / DSM 1962 / NBRC 6347 / NRRL 1970) TaxID=306901 RepID=Q2GT42_CHAGB|nr:uncharacterized protein CHGG_08862 [Chaetomium globosum CBS 148.51]EAQ84848.1 predicted protein [Chaetomium globosum CBS 148.51]
MVDRARASGSTAPTGCCRFGMWSLSWVARGKQSDRGPSSDVARATMWLAQKKMGTKRSGSGLVRVEPDQ